MKNSLFFKEDRHQWIPAGRIQRFAAKVYISLATT
jgi:hypothetical protein